MIQLQKQENIFLNDNKSEWKLNLKKHEDKKQSERFDTYNGLGSSSTNALIICAAHTS